MATERKPPKQPPVPQSALIDLQTGRPTKEFYDWMRALNEWAKQADAELT